MIEKLKELANKHNFTKTEKDWIKATSKELGLDFQPEKGCSNCWIDQVMKLYSMAKGSGLIEDTEQTEADYILKPHIDAMLYGVRYNNATLDEAKAKYLLSIGKENWFLKIKQDESNTAN